MAYPSLGYRIIEYDEYISPDGESYRFINGVDRWVHSVNGGGMPPIEYRTTRGPFQHGETQIDYVLRPRVMQLIHRRMGQSRTEYWDNRNDLLDLMRPNRQLTTGLLETGVLRKRRPDGSLRDLDVLIAEGPPFDVASDVWDEWAYETALRFIAFDPTFYDPTLQSYTFALASVQHLVFPIEFPIEFGESNIAETENITYIGTWLSYPTITIEGPAENLAVTNTATGKKIEITYDIALGETVTIQTAYGQKSIESDSAGSVIGTLTADSDLDFYLAPDPEATDGINPILVEAGGVSPSTSIVFSYYTRYIGI